MGSSATKAKNKYADKKYDRITIMVAKGRRQILKKYAESLGMSLNAYFLNLVDQDINKKGDSENEG